MLALETRRMVRKLCSLLVILCSYKWGNSTAIHLPDFPSLNSTTEATVPQFQLCKVITVTCCDLLHLVFSSSICVFDSEIASPLKGKTKNKTKKTVHLHLVLYRKMQKSQYFSGQTAIFYTCIIM